MIGFPASQQRVQQALQLRINPIAMVSAIGNGALDSSLTSPPGSSELLGESRLAVPKRANGDYAWGELLTLPETQLEHLKL